MDMRLKPYKRRRGVLFVGRLWAEAIVVLLGGRGNSRSLVYLVNFEELQLWVFLNSDRFTSYYFPFFLSVSSGHFFGKSMGGHFVWNVHVIFNLHFICKPLFLWVSGTDRHHHSYYTCFSNFKDPLLFLFKRGLSPL